MTYQDAVIQLRKLLQQHNASTADKVDVDAALKNVRARGGTMIESLTDMDQRDFVACGFGRVTAKSAVAMLKNGA